MELVQFFLFFLFLADDVEGTPLEVSNVDGWKDLSKFGVDLEVCTTLVYEVKCVHDHKMSLEDKYGNPLIVLLLGGWLNSLSAFTIHHNNAYSRPSTPNILNGDSFRWFWFSWGGGRFQFGKGRVPEEELVEDMENPLGPLIMKPELQKGNGAIATIRLGETERGRFVRVLQDGKFTNGMISETSTSRGRCAAMCSNHVHCGMFSHNQEFGLFAMFNRMTSSFIVTPENGWRSWKLLYCY